MEKYFFECLNEKTGVLEILHFLCEFSDIMSDALCGSIEN